MRATRQIRVPDALGRTLAEDVFDPRTRDEAGRAPLIAPKDCWLSTDVVIELLDAGFDTVSVYDEPATDHAR